MNTSGCVRITVSLVVVAALALLAQTSYAALAGKGNITGTIQTTDGKPAVGLVVKLVKDLPRDIRRPGSKGKSSGFDSGASGLQAQARTKIVSQATCDAQGKFTMQNVEPGGYRLEAGNRNMGWIYYDVEVEADKTVELNDLKLTKLE
jgi:hypothetical protein